MRVAYIQSIGGASGDMILGALLDLGVPLDHLQHELAKLGELGYDLTVSQETRREVGGAKLTVTLQRSQRHSPQHLLNVVRNSLLRQDLKESAERILSTLWQAESQVHHEVEELIELEELGTVDTLVDVVGVVVGLAYLGVERVYAASLVLGNTEPPRWAGGYSNPAPATLELIAMAGAPVTADHPIYEGAGELTTPTGAAIITALASFNRPAMTVRAIGVGLGAKDPESFPNVTRVWIGDVADLPATPRQSGIVLLETNLDDVPGVVLGHAQERLFAMGALDVWYTPVQMKKNRPGIVLSAMVPQEMEDAACEVILSETPTLGVRTRLVERFVADRENVAMETQLGPISVKMKYLGGKPVGAAPEFEDCRRIALEAGLPFQEVYQRAAAEARRQFLE